MVVIIIVKYHLVGKLEIFNFWRENSNFFIRACNTTVNPSQCRRCGNGIIENGESVSRKFSKNSQKILLIFINFYYDFL